MNKNPQIYFFLGKGGVGKSTTSSLFALDKSLKHEKTLLVSLDPAHNLGDIFETNFAEKQKQTSDYLSVIEVDTDLWVKKYLADTQNQFAQNYSYLSAYNLTSYLKMIKHSPGIEEYALFLAFKNIVFTKTEFQHIVFDMPPTALAIGFLSIPTNSLLWLNELKKLRTKINEKQEIISKIKFGKKIIESDKVLKKLEEMIREYEQIKNLLESHLSEIYVVTNNEKLSGSETLRIIEKLKLINKEYSKLLINKFTPYIRQEYYKNYERKLFLPFSDKELIGLTNLNEYLVENSIFF